MISSVVLRTSLLALVVLTSCLQLSPSRAGADSTVQSIFLGDRDCGDNPLGWCAYTFLPEHRYLHVVVHDVPGNDDWRIQIGPECSPLLDDALGGLQVTPSHYVEAVLDLATWNQGFPTSPLCFVFRGRNHWWVTYYAAYLDDNPVPDAADIYPGFQSLNGRPALPDLDVTYIHRTPAIAYDASPNTPAPGQPVTYTAHVLNTGGEAAPPFNYDWLLDGSEVAHGAVTSTLAPGEETALTFTWPWSPRPHVLRLQVYPSSTESSSSNDALGIRTDGLSLGFWVERGAFDYFASNQWIFCHPLACSGSDSFYDWLQRQVSTWNTLFASSSYPGLAPSGVEDRVNVDEVTIVPDGSLPLHGGLATNSPDAQDHTVDLEWGLPSQNVEKAYKTDRDGSFDVDWALLHELGHARYLADVYRFDIPITGHFAFDLTTRDGLPVFDPQRPFDPSNGIRAFTAGQDQTFLYANEEQDLMSCTCEHLYSAYDAIVLNRIRGRRARCGNANPPCNLGEWFGELPPVIRLRLLRSDGEPLPDGRIVRAYFDRGTAYTDHLFDASHSANMPVSNGTIDLGHDPFHTSGNVGAAGHNLLLLDLPNSGGDVYCFLEPTDFNMAYWEGYRDVAHPAILTIQIGKQVDNSCHPQLPPSLVNEPFAVSPSSSKAVIGATHGRAGKRYRPVTVTLVDDSTPGGAMRNRQLRVTTLTGRLLASSVTNSEGRAVVHVPASTTAVTITDVTDNGLTLSAAVGPRSH